MSSSFVMGLGFFMSSVTETMLGWNSIDEEGRYAGGQVSFMAEFARRLSQDDTNQITGRYTDKQLKMFYNQQMSGQTMRILREGEEEQVYVISAGAKKNCAPAPVSIYASLFKFPPPNDGAGADRIN
jgi:hypothetical protein